MSLTPEQTQAAKELGRKAAEWMYDNPHNPSCPKDCIHEMVARLTGWLPDDEKPPAVKEPIKVGDLIQHVSSNGAIYEVVQYREYWDDFLAVTVESDPRLTRIINQDNWKVISVKWGIMPHIPAPKPL